MQVTVENDVFRNFRGLYLERVKGIEPSFSAWEADVLPLNYTRNRVLSDSLTRRSDSTNGHSVVATIYPSLSEGFERHSQEQANARFLNAELFTGERDVGITKRQPSADTGLDS